MVITLTILTLYLTATQKVKGNAKYLGVYDDSTGGSLDILGNGEPNTGRIGNVKE